MTDRMDEKTKKIERDARANPDPITGEPGSHPVGPGVSRRFLSYVRGRDRYVRLLTFRFIAA